MEPMSKKAGGNTGSRRGHVKYAGIADRTIARYKKQVRNFFAFLHVHDGSFPHTMDELDTAAGDYVNHLYQEGEPYGYATDFVSGLRRLYPRCRRHLGTAQQYCKFWGKGIRRRRALPLPADVLVGMVGVAFAYGDEKGAVTMLVGFLGLLRTEEMLSLRRRQLRFIQDKLVVISLPGSKGSQRKGYDECVLIHDPMAIRLLLRVVQGLGGEERVFDGSLRDLGARIKRYAEAFGVSDPSLTPYCLRRGGATWHFARYASLDATQALGRWEHASTAKIYINQALSDSTALSLSGRAAARLERCKRVLARLAALPLPPPPLPPR